MPEASNVYRKLVKVGVRPRRGRMDSYNFFSINI